MSNDTSRIEIITGRERRRRYSAEHKLQLVEETMQPGMTVSAVARLQGVSPSLLFKRRQLMSEGGRTAVRADEDVVGSLCRSFRKLTSPGLELPPLNRTRGWLRMAFNELMRRAHLQAAMGMILVVVIDPKREHLQYGCGIWSGLDPGVVALECFDECFADVDRRVSAGRWPSDLSTRVDLRRAILTSGYTKKAGDKTGRHDLLKKPSDAGLRPRTRDAAHPSGGRHIAELLIELAIMRSE